MKVSGFTIVRNAVKFDYPIVEAVTSLLPLVDEMIVSIGDSEDNTEALIRSINSPKIRIVHSTWDKTLKEGGKVLAVETDKAMDACSADADWLFYIQADEVVHEKYLPVIRRAMETHLHNTEVEGLLFKYLHFYGSYRYVADGRKWYSNEIRVIRNNRQIRAYRDAQGFRCNGRKLKVKPIDAYIYHYGWVKNPVFMQQKRLGIATFWEGERSELKKKEDAKKEGSSFDYSKIDTLDLFRDTHPAVMEKRIKEADWDFSFDITKKQFRSMKYRILYFLDKRFGWRPFEYKNYTLI